MSYQFEIRQLRYFSILAETLNYRQAAEQLFISQPGLSRQIKAMEDRLGYPLFERNNRKVALTAAGQYLQQEANFFLHYLDRIGHRLEMVHHGQAGEVQIGFLGSAVTAVLPDLLEKMNAALPEVEISLQERSNHEQIDGILNDRLDIGFVRLARVPRELVLREVDRDSFSLALPLDHPINARNFTHVGQVANEPFILFDKDYSPLYYDKIMSICEDQGFTPRVGYRSVHAHTIFRLVERGLGVAIIPTSLKQGFNLGVQFIELRGIRQETVLSAVWKKENRNPVVGQVLELLFDRNNQA